jgi:multiple sugar transport system permease protein/putative aldouronate transport system permease protein
LREGGEGMKEFFRNTWKHRAHVVMALPVFLILFFIMYVPMAGLVMAFKKYDMTLGIWKSPWNGLENFKFLIASKATFVNFTRNTILYYLLFTSVGTLLNVVLAIAIDQLMLKKMAKTMQTLMIIPVFISYAAVQFIVYAFISKDTGLINSALGTSTSFYTQAKYWPAIVTITKIWKDTGYGSVLYMSVLAGIDTELYEAAEIDGANRWKKIWHITLPSLIPMITVMLLLSVGNVMRSDTGLFYQITRDSGILYSTTQVIDSYVLHAIFQNSNFGFTAATSFFQSIVGLLLMLFANWLVRKIQPENALF